MDILEEKRILVESIELKQRQLEELKQKLVNEYNAEVIRRQEEAKKAQEAQEKAAKKQAESK